MAIFMRNVFHGQTSWTTSSQFWMRFMVTWREIFLAGRWTEVYKTNTAEWNNNILVSLGDCAVSSVTAYRVTSATGGFTGHSGDGITLIAPTNDENCGVFRIQKVVDDNTIDIEPMCAPPDGWVTEGSIVGRVFDWGDTDPLTNGTELVMAPPTGNNELHLSFASGYVVTFKAYPDTYNGGAGHPTNIDTWSQISADKKCYFNAHFSGSDAIVYWFTESQKDFLAVGELTNVQAGDTYPGFLVADAVANFDPFIVNELGALKMIDSATPTTKLNFEIMTPVIGSNASATAASRQQNIQVARTSKGKAMLRKNWVYEGTTLGGYPRGKVPNFRITNSNWEDYRPMGVAENWLHLERGLVVPKNGPNDPLPSLDAG